MGRKIRVSGRRRKKFARFFPIVPDLSKKNFVKTSGGGEVTKFQNVL
jgi:hypothetical protein